MGIVLYVNDVQVLDLDIAATPVASVAAPRSLFSVTVLLRFLDWKRLLLHITAISIFITMEAPSR